MEHDNKGLKRKRSQSTSFETDPSFHDHVLRSVDGMVLPMVEDLVGDLHHQNSDSRIHYDVRLDEETPLDSDIDESEWVRYDQPEDMISTKTQAIEFVNHRIIDPILQKFNGNSSQNRKSLDSSNLISSSSTSKKLRQGGGYNLVGIGRMTTFDCPYQRKYHCRFRIRFLEDLHGRVDGIYIYGRHEHDDESHERGLIILPEKTNEVIEEYLSLAHQHANNTRNSNEMKGKSNRWQRLYIPQNPVFSNIDSARDFIRKYLLPSPPKKYSNPPQGTRYLTKSQVESYVMECPFRVRYTCPCRVKFRVENNGTVEGIYVNRLHVHNAKEEKGRGLPAALKRVITHLLKAVPHITTNQIIDFMALEMPDLIDANHKDKVRNYVARTRRTTKTTKYSTACLLNEKIQV